MPIAPDFEDVRGLHEIFGLEIPDLYILVAQQGQQSERAQWMPHEVTNELVASFDP